uniref:Chromatin associated protein KTI12 n=1 Tax=Mycena chlorophos TaxID=658473 RepID=A0ABQ0M2P3_MYCCL|nr:predicted protein [Mycena chlorophos]
MALVTLTGYPASGKTTRAAQLEAALPGLLPDHLSVCVVSDESLKISPSVYDDSRTEKPARAALFTAVQRLMSPTTVLIVDAPNYIKGFRYQLYCAAREMKLRVCTVYTVATPDSCRKWNALRTDNRTYETATLENLLVRFEEPSSMVRWDSPLFTVPWNEDLPTTAIVDAILSGSIKPPNSGTISVAKAPSDALHVLERITTATVAAIINASAQAEGGGGVVTLPIATDVQIQISLPARHLTLSELQRLKRQFVTVHKKAVTLGTTERGAVDWTEESVAQKFVTYLGEHLKP